MTEHADRSTFLSPDGLRRRDVMREELLGALHRHHRRRRVQRHAAALVLTLACIVAAIALRGAESPSLRRIAEEASMPTAPEAMPTTHTPAWRIARVSTAPGTRERFRASAASRFTILTDGDLVRELAAAGRPGGLVRQHGRAWILWPREQDDDSDSAL